MKKIAFSAKLRKKQVAAAKPQNTGKTNWLFLVILCAGVGVGAGLSLFFPLAGGPAQLTGEVIAIGSGNEKIAVVEELPLGAVHWHAQLNILAHKSNVPIPAAIGITVGKNIDNQVSGAQASPIHTHDDSGRLHLENEAPRLHGDKMTLGYFFGVWGKRFGKECVFEYCNGPGGQVKFFVNGAPDGQYEKYSIRDGDELVIEYG